MNPRLLLTCLSSAGLFLTGCNKSELEIPATSPGKTQAARPLEPPTPPASPLAAGPSESEQKLAQQLREMQTRQLELELKLEDEKLARTEAEIAKERDLLEMERIAWNREQELAVAKLTPPASSEEPDSTAPAGRNYDYQMFYDDLAPLGSWYDCGDYGYVWQPTICVTDNTWRPYTLGSWANCDQGWAWCSDEPFGWACYHYGRWAQLRGRGWVWVPGDQWAPCWVSWRRNDNYIGWCPLPPETVYDRDCTYGPTIDRDCGIHPGWYVFMPVKHFDRPCRNYCEVPATCLTICSTTVCITNIVIRPGRVECHGPKYDWIRDCVRRPVPRYTLARETEFADRGHRGPRLEKDKLRCYTPKVQAPWNTQLRPARHAALDSQEVVRAEGGLPDKVASRFRTEKQERAREVGSLKGGAKMIAERQQRLAGLEQTRESLREQRARVDAGTGTGATPDNSTARVERPARDEKPQSRPGKQIAGDTPSSRALAIPGTASSPVSNQPGGAEANARREQSAAEKTVTEKDRRDAEAAARREVAANDKERQDELSSRRADLEEKRRQQRESGAVRPQIAAQPATEPQPRVAETTAPTESKARADAAAREMEKQAALRAQLEEKRRQQQEVQNDQSKAQAAAQRTAIEQRRAAETAARRESDNQSATRAAQEQQRRQADAEGKAEQQARQRESMEQQRAAIEQQRRQADAEARAEQQRRQADELQRRQAEAETRQREAQEEQRRNAAEQQQRRQAEESQRRQAEESQRRQAESESRQRDMEQQRRQAEEQQRRQADERAKEASEQQRRQAENQDREERGRGKR